MGVTEGEGTPGSLVPAPGHLASTPLTQLWGSSHPSNCKRGQVIPCEWGESSP